MFWRLLCSVLLRILKQAEQFHVWKMQMGRSPRWFKSQLPDSWRWQGKADNYMPCLWPAKPLLSVKICDTTKPKLKDYNRKVLNHQILKVIYYHSIKGQRKYRKVGWRGFNYLMWSKLWYFFREWVNQRTTQGINLHFVDTYQFLKLFLAFMAVPMLI